MFGDTGDGRLLEVHDRFGQALTLDWTSSPATATDDSGRATEITINGSDQVTSVEDSAGREWTFGYSSGKLATITDPEGDVTTFGYTSTLLTSIERDRQLSGATDTIRWEFAFAGARVDTVLDPLGLANSPDRFHTFTYDGEETTVVSPRDYAAGTTVITTYGIDGAGRLIDERSPIGLLTEVTPDDYGNPESIVTDEDPDTEVTYEYNGDGVLTKEIAPGPNGDVTTTYALNATNDILSITRTQGASVLDGTVEYTYASGELTSETVDDGGLDLETSYDYTAEHQLKLETANDGTVTRYEYDSHGNMTARIENYVSGQSATSSRNVRTEYDHDAAGDVIEETDPLGRVTTYAYDDLGRQTWVTRNDVAGSSSDGDEDITERTWYDAMGWVSATEDPRGTVTRRVTDRLGRVTRTIVHCTDSGTTPSGTPHPASLAAPRTPGPTSGPRPPTTRAVSRR